MRPRAEVDPELHLLRSVARLVPDSRARGELESARFQLFAAFEARDAVAAARWLRALRVAFVAADLGEAREDAIEALATLHDAIEAA